MAFDHQIEVAVPAETSTTERGRILERLAAKFLGTQNYKIEQEVRLTATEVDLLGAEKTTGEKIFVECKAYRSTIAADVLQKLLGNVTFKKYSSGWLLTTFALGKDAKGFQEEWNQRPPEERRRLQIYPPEGLVARLVSAGMFIDPNSLAIDKKRFNPGTDAILVLTLQAEYWAIPVIDADSGIRTGALLFKADTGKRITDSQTLGLVSNTDTTINVPWLTDAAESQAGAVSKLRDELQSIVRVPVADNWADYRPARPEDFVGRLSVQSDVFDFFEAVRAKSTQTRLLALKGPSGWGKSSTVLKIASRAGNIRNRGKFFVFTVDSRAATTGRFPELAIATAIKAAIKNGFVEVGDSLEFGGATSIFSTPAMQTLSLALEQQGRVLCVFFDQFEELLYKADLAEVFNQMRGICAAVEEAQSNLVVGFSWKTDGVIPTEHSAYHLWHTLSDHRVELTLTPFSDKEVVKAINRFAKELGQPLIPQLRRVLQDHSQGFPWLLKKLCVHILELVRSGIEQVDILNQSINIESLFKRDLENLAPAEHACLKQIAQESPAEFFRITQDFGDDVVSRLVDKRLVIRSGTRLTIYWDIFRDYILTEKIPHIPVTYIPQSSFPRYARALLFMVGKSQLTYAELAKHMGLGLDTTDNLVRDLANLGHVEANRKEAKIVPAFKTEQHAIEIALAYWNAHEIVREFRDLAGEDTVSVEEFNRIYKEASKHEEFGAKTLSIYSSRVLSWLRGLGVIAQIGNTLLLANSSQKGLASLADVTEGRSVTDIFLGEAPPAKVVAAFKSICTSRPTRAELERSHGRNACYSLMKLGLMGPDGSPLVVVDTKQAEQTLASRVSAAPTVRAAIELLKQSQGSVPGLDVGQYLANRFGAKWSEGSLRRHGTALRQWAEWSLALGGAK
jgi:Holliday junction resolvase-like predicted endonuclease